MARDESRVTSWWVFAAIMLSIAGVLDVIWGIAAVGNSKFFIADQKYIFSTLNTWGWVAIVLGAGQLLAAFSLLQGGGFGRWVGIVFASLSAIYSLLAIPAYPLWSLCIFALAIVVVYQLARPSERA